MWISCAPVLAEENIWTSLPTDFGKKLIGRSDIPPAADQSVSFSSPGFNTLTINSNTAAMLPESLSVLSLAISAPAHSLNALGCTDKPADTVEGEVPHSGDQFVADAHLCRAPAYRWHGEGMSVGGQVDQNTGSRVTGQQVDVGFIGPGIYHLNGGLLDVRNFYVGGLNQGVFNQNGGTNNAGVFHLEAGGTYNLRGGSVDGTLYFNGGTILRQTGGRINRGFGIYRGTYLLENGSASGTTVPVPNPNSPFTGFGRVSNPGAQIQEA